MPVAATPLFTPCHYASCCLSAIIRRHRRALYAIRLQLLHAVTLFHYFAADAATPLPPLMSAIRCRCHAAMLPCRHIFSPCRHFAVFAFFFFAAALSPPCLDAPRAMRLRYEMFLPPLCHMLCYMQRQITLRVCSLRYLPLTLPPPDIFCRHFRRLLFAADAAAADLIFA